MRDSTQSRPAGQGSSEISDTDMKLQSTLSQTGLGLRQGSETDERIQFEFRFQLKMAS